MPYTYFLKNIITNQVYYGVRYAKNCDPSDFWNTYFTSCKKVHELIKRYGKESFSFIIKKTFHDKRQAVKYEEKVLRRLKVWQKDVWLNNNVSGGFINQTPEMIKTKHEKRKKTLELNPQISWSKGLTQHTDIRVAKRSKKLKGQSKSDSHKQALRKPKLNKINMGKYIRTPEYKQKMSEKLRHFNESKRCQF